MVMNKGMNAGPPFPHKEDHLFKVKFMISIFIKKGE